MTDLKPWLQVSGGNWCVLDSPQMLRYNARQAGRAPWNWTRLQGYPEYCGWPWPWITSQLFPLERRPE